IPVVCSLQDEDVWVDAMNETYRKKVWNLMSERAKDVDAFISVSDYYTEEMKQKMNIPSEKMHIVHIGLETELYRPSQPAENPQVIGYLSRMYKEHGFGLLIDAFIKLKTKPDFKNILLKLSGGYTADDKGFVKKQIRKLKKAGIYNDVEFITNFKTEQLHNFFEKLTILSVPVLKGEAFGTYLIEALACGVPLVQPALGAFPEIIEITKAGVVYEPNTPDALVEKWVEVLSEPEKIKIMSKNGIKSVSDNFTNEILTKKVLKIYEGLV
ncbi:MAG: glycosyltransferase family 4 protein, partial [Bacteroidales bacterium]|nr:glycosyltransferase family 4 protein [Bacteroidales bacterium]